MLEPIHEATHRASIRPVGAVDRRHIHCHAVVEQDDSGGCQLGPDSVEVELGLLFGVQAVDEGEFDRPEHLVFPGTDEVLRGHEEVPDVGHAEPGKVRGDGVCLFPEVIDERRVDEPHRALPTIIVQGLAENQRGEAAVRADHDDPLGPQQPGQRIVHPSEAEVPVFHQLSMPHAEHVLVPKQLCDPVVHR